MKIKNKKQLSDISLTPDEQETVLRALALVTKLIKGLNVSFKCPACDHYEDGFCKHFNESVPEHFLTKGCDNWSDPIPF